jgi:hypothetical protein
MSGPVVWEARFGVDSTATFILTPSRVNGPTLDLESAPAIDLLGYAGPAATLDLFAQTAGADATQPFPDALLYPDDPSAHLSLDFTLETSEAGGFIFAFEFDNGSGDVEVDAPPTALSELTDVDFTTPPSDGQFLAFSATTGKWRAATATGEGGPITSGDVTSALGYTPTSLTSFTGVRTLAALKTALNLTKADVGLGNVNNTSDAGKPVSTAQQAALDLKADADDVAAALALKADTSTVNAALALKADADDVATALALKADASTVPHLLGDLADVEAGTGAPQAGDVLTFKDGVWQAEPTQYVAPPESNAAALAIVFGG